MTKMINSRLPFTANAVLVKNEDFKAVFYLRDSQRNPTPTIGWAVEFEIISGGAIYSPPSAFVASIDDAGKVQITMPKADVNLLIDDAQWECANMLIWAIDDLGERYRVIAGLIAINETGVVVSCPT